jgi:hypothetical protein
MQGGSAKDKKKRCGILLSIWWMIWKERNNRIFDQQERSAQRLATCILDLISLHQLVGVIPEWFLTLKAISAWGLFSCSFEMHCSHSAGLTIHNKLYSSAPCRTSPDVSWLPFFICFGSSVTSDGPSKCLALGHIQLLFLFAIVRFFRIPCSASNPVSGFW